MYFTVQLLEAAAVLRRKCNYPICTGNVLSYLMPITCATVLSLKSAII